ncbi:hypothetical protein lerEdw1_006038 [Lerista edwardsae]|nr:hypothetical protein lerEdw1_006038 [Lerista edwardsae]
MVIEGRALMLSSAPVTGHLSAKPEVICKIEQEEEPCLEEPLESPQWRRPQSPWLDRARKRPGQRRRQKKPYVPGGEKPVTRAKSAPPKGEDDALPRVTLKMNPPKCPECGKSFLSNVAMTIHIRTHTGERPFKCHLCPKGFPSRGDLKRHIKTHLRKKEPPGASAAPKGKNVATVAFDPRSSCVLPSSPQ